MQCRSRQILRGVDYSMGSDVPSDDRLKGLFYPGKRLSYMGDLCTVRYVGPLEATQGEWLGVEWDDEHRGKHDGHHRAVSVFRCLSPSVTAASFVKPTRLADCPRTLLEALHSKYTPNVLERNPTTRHEQRIEISGKTVEEIGFDKIMKEQAALEKLRFAVLDKLNLKGIVDDHCLRHRVFEAQVELQRLCPDVIELEISWNLLETWQDLVDIVAAFPQLRVLRAWYGTNYLVQAYVISPLQWFTTKRSGFESTRRPNNTLIPINS